MTDVPTLEKPPLEPDVTDLIAEAINAVNDALKEEFRDRLWEAKLNGHRH